MGVELGTPKAQRSSIYVSPLPIRLLAPNVKQGKRGLQHVLVKITLFLFN